TTPERGILFDSKVLIWPADTFPSTPIQQRTEGGMHISQRALRSFVICFAILMLLPVAGTAIVGTGIVTLPLFFFTNTGALSCKPGNLVRQSHGRRLERALRQAVEYRYVKYHDFVRECYWRRVQLKWAELPNDIGARELRTISGDIRTAGPRTRGWEHRVH